eukprot:GHRQ01021210.1.p1 GENE.GHRQ01021210.1~~GHRQ01021210.1.p1  ORF type:complete len:203 (+),score=59.77 GHRQ01021210.1:63-671(+)
MPGGGGCMQLGLICRWFRLASPLIAATLPPARLVMHAVTCLAIRGDLAETRLDSSSTGMAPFRVCGVVCHADVTRRASQLLLAHRGLLTAPQLARLAAKMSEVGMTREITGLVDSSVASGSHQGQAVGFVAAALTGDLVRLQGALQLSGTDALAALQANTYRLPTAMATERCWNAALRHNGAAAATHATSSYAYYTVTQSGL